MSDEKTVDEHTSSTPSERHANEFRDQLVEECWTQYLQTSSVDPYDDVEGLEPQLQMVTDLNNLGPVYH